MSQASVSGKTRDQDRLVLFALLLVVAAGALLRIQNIGDKGLWIDEAFSVWLGYQPMPDMLSWLVRIDQHPPLYYLLLRLWMYLGENAATVRLLSVMIGILNIPAIYLLGRRLAGHWVGLLSAVLLAFSPFHVRFAQEARMYTLLSLNVTLAAWMLVRLLTDPRAATVPVGKQLVDLGRAWRTRAVSGNWTAPYRAIETDLAWVAYVVVTAAALLTHNTAVLFPIAVNLFVLGLWWYRRRYPAHQAVLQLPLLRNWIVAQAVILLLWSPWSYAFIVQVRGVYRHFWLAPPTWQTVLRALGDLTCAFLPDRISWAWMIWGMYGVIALLGLWGLRRRPVCLFLLLSLLLVPFAGELLVSVWRPIFYDRTLIWASVPLYLLLAAGLRQMRYRSYVLAAVAILLTVNLLSVRQYQLYFEKEQWDDAAAYVAQRAQEGDLLLFHATWVQIPFDFYFRDLGLPLREHGLPVDLFDRGVLEPKMEARDLPRLRELVRSSDRVWLIYSHNWYTDPQGLIAAEMERSMDLVRRRRFYGLEVRLYESPVAD